MRQETFAILFLMRKGRPKKNGLAPIFARITTGGLRQEVYTQCDSNPETWNQHKERAMGTNKLAIQVNERLNDFRVKIIDIRTKLLAEGYAANAAQIKQRYLNPTCNTMMLIAGLADYAKRRQGEVGVRITQRTADKYERLLRYLKQYLAQRGGVGVIGQTDGITAVFLNGGPEIKIFPMEVGGVADDTAVILHNAGTAHAHAADRLGIVSFRQSCDQPCDLAGHVLRP